jgi:hypothetical protein
MRQLSAIGGWPICGCLLLAALFACGYRDEQLPKGHEVSSTTSPDGLSRAFVWMPEQSGLLGATESQPYELWVQYLKGEQTRALLLKADRTEGVRVTWKSPRELEVCYGPSQIYYLHNFFYYGTEQSRQLYSIEVLLRRVSILADCK